MAKILVVDDSESTRNLIAGIVKNCGHETLVAGNGYDGLKQLRRNGDCALAFIDVNMPEMDGLTMMKEIIMNEKGYYQDIPLVVVTTEDKKETIEMAKMSGVKAWCIKPITPEEISSILDRLLTAN